MLPSLGPTGRGDARDPMRTPPCSFPANSSSLHGLIYHKHNINGSHLGVSGNFAENVQSCHNKNNAADSMVIVVVSVWLDVQGWLPVQCSSTCSLSCCTCWSCGAEVTAAVYDVCCYSASSDINKRACSSAVSILVTSPASQSCLQI